MLFRGFWNNLKKPIIGLSPMDGVTDAAFRYMICKYSRPDVVMTEFTNVEGLARGAAKMLVSFEYNEIERPVVAQIFGIEPESYYKCAVMLCSLGFDGIDINMGCPCNNIARKGGGAGLIQTPKLAKKLIKITKKAVKDWAEGITVEEAGVHPDVIAECERMRARILGGEAERRLIPVSVKTRIGYDKVVAEEWVATLLEEKPANITMHGRTLKQRYTGRADWEVLGRAAKVVKGSGVGTSFLGNGDVSSMADACKKIADYGLDGVLVGRATLGNPWFFGEKEPSAEERLKALLEHVQYFNDVLGDRLFFHNIKKHLAWYTKSFSGAREMRMRLMQSNSVDDVAEILKV